MTTSWHCPLSKYPLSRTRNRRIRCILRSGLFGRHIFFNSAFTFISVKFVGAFVAESFNPIPLGLLRSFFGFRYAFSLFNHLG